MLSPPKLAEPPQLFENAGSHSDLWGAPVVHLHPCRMGIRFLPLFSVRLLTQGTAPCGCGGRCAPFLQKRLWGTWRR